MSMINDLRKYEPLYVIGHKKPDVDTVFSSYLLSSILNYLGIKSYPCVLSEGYELNKYNKNIIDDYLEYNPIIIDVGDIKKYNFVLVDHNDPIQSIGDNSNIVFGMDHHKKLKNIENILFSDLCSNSLFIYDYFKEVYPFSEKEKALVMIATLTDTLFFKTDRYKSKDKELVSELRIEVDSNLLLDKYFIETDLSKGLESIIEKSDRDFSYLGISFSSSVIYTKSEKEDLRESYRTLILNGSKNHLGIWSNLENNKTYVFFKANNKTFEKTYAKIASRAATVMPDIINYLEKNR